MDLYKGAVAPGAEDIEVIVFGPGYGESIALHLGDGDWVIVDSCLDPSGSPAPLTYLQAIGVSLDRVKYVMVTHWHDDHSKGIEQVVANCGAALVGVSSVLNRKEAHVYLSAYSGEVADTSRGTRELYTLWRNNAKTGRVKSVGINRTLLTSEEGKLPYRITALSPTDECSQASAADFASLIPKNGTPLREATRFTPNNEAVVLHVAIGDFAIILGADLETNKHGWSAVVKDSEVLKLRPAEVFKVAHHGSPTAECKEVWDSLLQAKPLSILTPFHHGSHRLPNPDDRVRITGRSGSAHITSASSARPQMDAKIARRLGQLGTEPIPLNRGFGAVSARRNVAGGSAWAISYYGAAGVL